MYYFLFLILKKSVKLSFLVKFVLQSKTNKDKSTHELMYAQFAHVYCREPKNVSKLLKF